MAVISEYLLENTGAEVQKAISDALINLPYNIGLKANTSDVLTKNNTTAYIPTQPYHPTTKQYVDSIRPTISIGTVTTGDEGTSASVTNSGTSSDVILNFTIPRGNTGDAAGFATPTATVTTLSAGSDATVSVSSSGAATNKLFSFSFGIPQGIQGIQGVQGYYVDTIAKTSGTSAPGTVDTYTMYLNDENDTIAGTFNVYNGADGTGAGTVTSVGLTSNDNSINISNSPITSNGNISISINKETTINSSSTDSQIPSARAVYTLFNSIVNGDNISY